MRTVKTICCIVLSASLIFQISWLADGELKELLDSTHFSSQQARPDLVLELPINFDRNSMTESRNNLNGYLVRKKKALEEELARKFPHNRLNGLPLRQAKEYRDILLKFQALRVQKGQLYQLRHRSERPCTMATCFDYSRCGASMKVYVYPPTTGNEFTPFFKELLSGLHLYGDKITTNPDEACAFIVTMDTISRDPKHVNGFSVVDPETVQDDLRSLSHWNSGLNHIVIVCFVGVFPSFLSDIDFDAGKAIVAMASPNSNTFREGFDIALPHLPLYTLDCGYTGGAPRHMLGSFVGRRHKLHISNGYWTESGFFERDKLFNLRKVLNDSGILVLESCDDIRDTCETFINYNEIMCNSTFGLIAPGRRAGTWRFMESVSARTIPVLISGNSILPFHELIDWATMIVPVSADLLHYLPKQLASISPYEVQMMQDRLNETYTKYFASTSLLLPAIISTLERRVALGIGHENLVYGRRPVLPYNVGKPTSRLSVEISGHTMQELLDSLDSARNWLQFGEEAKLVVKVPYELENAARPLILNMHATVKSRVDMFCLKHFSRAAVPEMLSEPVTNAIVLPGKTKVAIALDLFHSWENRRLSLHGPHCSYTEVWEDRVTVYEPCGRPLHTRRGSSFNFVHITDAIFLGAYRVFLQEITSKYRARKLDIPPLCLSYALNIIAGAMNPNSTHFERSFCQPCRKSTDLVRFGSRQMAQSCVDMLRTTAVFDQLLSKSPGEMRFGVNA